ncbi:GT4 family glycosyltransferase PelF [Sporosarcina cyprini]|uniref:GT4 family glycosyltransferase PelF n=1 Tax=Sporosarcina cyprini TaxID=2910523 RepID=UPI001EDE08EC|nr:GT4 family glycosyltransferase PelF [Sporosarcina cyprini]MCG3088000.1 GT4 family glycosyltransferase PelF [Sporosarcina cyprini]
MKICLIAEGSYPYVTGGVSTWINTLMSEMPEHEFGIYAISADSKRKGQFLYDFPSNFMSVKEVFLDSYGKERSRWGRHFKLTSDESQNLASLISGDGETDWGKLFDLLRSKKFKNTVDFLSSRDYFDIVEKLAKETYPEVPFTELYWTVNSMILPLLILVREEIPEADLYHSVSTGYAGIVGVLAKHLYGKPLILTEHGIYSREREEEIIKADWVKGEFKDLWIRYFYTLSGAIYEAADEVITLFHRNKEIEVELGCPDEKVSIIPNGVEIEQYAHLLKRHEDGYQDGMVRIGAIVRVVAIKDIKTMIQGFALVEREIPNAIFYIMGPVDEDETYYEECCQLIDSLQVKNIHFTGLVDVHEYIGKMDVIVLTSISEGQPLAILEAMASGKPVVATNVGGCKELLLGKEDGYGPAGIICPVLHYGEIARAIITLCKDEKLREAMGQNGYERARELYKKSEFIEKYRTLYQTVGG